MEANKTSNYDFTIIVPIYNEEDNMPALEKALGEYLKKSLVKSCVLFVNDGSRDTSLDKIREICDRNDDFYFISSAENHGLSTAMKAGFDVAGSKLVGYIDGDLQTNPEDFNLLLPYAKDFEMVTGIRANRKDSWGKRMQSKIANGFRRKIPFFNGMHRFLAALVTLEGGKMKELPVRHYPRTQGVSKYHLSNRLIKPFEDCFAFRWMKSRYIRYNVGENNISK